MDVVVKGRHCAVSEAFRAYVEEKITRLEKLDGRVIRVDVEVSAERNKRQHDQASRVEITLRNKGPVIRAEAAAEDQMAAFDMALDKLMAQLRKAADRKRVHRGQRTPQSLQSAAAQLPLSEGSEPVNGADVHSVAGIEVHGDGPPVVREKVHAAVPMSLDQALLEMELVGHDFYLFHDVDTDRASVVYRRRGWSYGVLHLDLDGTLVDPAEAGADVEAAAS